MYLLECSIYILKYVVAVVVGCGVWEEGDTLVHTATEGVMSQLTLQLSRGNIARACDIMQNKCFFTIYRAVSKAFAFTLHCVALCTTPTLKTTTPIITFKAASENVNCILFLSVEKCIKSVCILKQNISGCCYHYCRRLLLLLLRRP